MGSGLAANSLGICYLLGKGTSQNLEEAFLIFKISADAGNPAAFGNLGKCYMFGYGTNVNSYLGLEYYEKAADSSFSDAQFFLGSLYYNGASDYCENASVVVDYPKAYKYLMMAFENSSTREEFKGEIARLLSKCYLFGRGVEQNENKAEELLEIASQYGDVDAEVIKELLQKP
ncbi:MAG: sel1 repeat family protein [Muribaculaceae bacterium]|nr:sel1 repeat family protein [Muribaculaceae bacterium]